MATHNFIPVIVPITKDFYEDETHFWHKLEMLRLFYKGHEQDIKILVSYRYFKPTITEKQIMHYKKALEVFPSLEIIFAKGVKWGKNKENVRDLGIRIHEGAYSPVGGG